MSRCVRKNLPGGGSTDRAPALSRVCFGQASTLPGGQWAGVCTATFWVPGHRGRQSKAEEPQGKVSHHLRAVWGVIQDPEKLSVRFRRVSAVTRLVLKTCTVVGSGQCGVSKKAQSFWTSWAVPLTEARAARAGLHSHSAHGK